MKNFWAHFSGTFRYSKHQHYRAEQYPVSSYTSSLYLFEPLSSVISAHTKTTSQYQDQSQEWYGFNSLFFYRFAIVHWNRSFLRYLDAHSYYTLQLYPVIYWFVPLLSKNLALYPLVRYPRLLPQIYLRKALPTGWEFAGYRFQ